MGQSTLEFTDENITLREMVHKFYQKRGQSFPVNSAYYLEHKNNKGVPLNLQSKVTSFEPKIFILHMEYTDFSEIIENSYSNISNLMNKNYVFYIYLFYFF